MVKRFERLLPVIDANYRRRAIAQSLVTIDTIIGTHMKTISDTGSASIVIRATCERRARHRQADELSDTDGETPSEPGDAAADQSS